MKQMEIHLKPTITTSLAPAVNEWFAHSASNDVVYHHVVGMQLRPRSRVGED
jgi:hypothetical protein